ncbi:MAG TPA: hypothetical protein VK348_06235 [Planctomycetota bacterium]|nr:hypothetical protein [Planctomycetota bacterium]
MRAAPLYAEQRPSLLRSVFVQGHLIATLAADDPVPLPAGRRSGKARLVPPQELFCRRPSTVRPEDFWHD